MILDRSLESGILWLLSKYGRAVLDVVVDEALVDTLEQLRVHLLFPEHRCLRIQWEVEVEVEVEVET